jgi:sugar O-acyltransferase (sialic acid O-acetyltransferase NeuD family)
MAINKILLIGCGVLAEQIIHAIKHYDTNVKVVGFVDDTVSIGTIRYEITCLGAIKEIKEIFAAGGFDKLLISIGYNYLKERRGIFNSLKNNYSFYTFIHPTAYIDVSVKVGAGSFISAGVHLEKDVTIGDNTFVYNNVVVCHDSCVGAHSFISPMVCIAGYTVIGQCCMLGIGSVIIDHLNIADFVRSGAGTVVINSLLISGTYIGNPAQILNRP